MLLLPVTALVHVLCHCHMFVSLPCAVLARQDVELAIPKKSEYILFAALSEWQQGMCVGPTFAQSLLSVSRPPECLALARCQLTVACHGFGEVGNDRR